MSASAMSHHVRRLWSEFQSQEVMAERLDAIRGESAELSTFVDDLRSRFALNRETMLKLPNGDV